MTQKNTGKLSSIVKSESGTSYETPNGIDQLKRTTRVIVSIAIPTLIVFSLGFVALLAQYSVIQREQTAAMLKDFHSLERKHEAAQRLIDILPGGVAIFSETGRVKYVNQGFEEISGRRRRDLIGMTIYELLPERFREDHRPRFNNAEARQFLREGSAFCLPQGRMLLPDGTEVSCKILVTPLLVSQGMHDWQVFIDPRTVTIEAPMEDET